LRADPPPREHTPRPVRELPPTVAQKIAAGEVIDRPAAVVRELLDNAIDAGATKITVEIDGGGIERIRVTDNGCGMTAEDLALCTRTHTTSKIASEDDLLSLSTLGFRGEALSSIQAVSRLEITTTRDGHEAWKLELGTITPSRLARGTAVLIENLFENFPARRQFLKRASAESSLCRQTFIEKALAWPEIEFRFSVDGASRHILSGSQNFRDRAISALSPKEPEEFFHEIAGTGNGFSFQVVLGSPEAVRSDRRDIMVFVNGRRIMEYSLLQAIEYGAEGHFPNGGHPFALLFIEIDPSLVDFNIHPAKREARFRDSGALHHAVSSTVRNFYRQYTIASLKRGLDETPQEQLFDKGDSALHREQYSRDYASERSSSVAAFPAIAAFPAHSYTVSQGMANDSPARQEASLRLLGQVLGTFIACEKNGYFYLIDQHAAHERILFDAYLAHSGETQELLVPYRIETNSKAEDRHLAENAEALAKSGFRIIPEGDGIWQVISVPARWAGTEKDIREDLADLSAGPEKLVSHLYATAACRAAVKDGDVLDDHTARAIAETAFALEEPVCPHGRPLWIMMDREELFKRIKRS
jgi:DNA mismatch repair protein MutL